MVTRVRPADDMDWNSLLDLIVELARDEGKGDVDQDAVIAAIRKCINYSGSAVFVAESTTRIIGYIAVHWVPFPMLGGMEGYISDLVVARDCRGEGVGRSLVESFKRAFYPKIGFHIRDEFANLTKLLR